MSQATVQQQINGLYIAIYGRAADAGGYPFWVNFVAQQPDGAGINITTAQTTPVSTADAAALGVAFVNTQSSFFNLTYGALNDTQFIQALYQNIGGNEGNADGLAFWIGKLVGLEGQGATVQAARAAIVGQFTHDLASFDTTTQPSGMTAVDFAAAVQRTETFLDKISVSEVYEALSSTIAGAFLIGHLVSNVPDAGYLASERAIQGVTFEASTVLQAVQQIQNAVSSHNLSIIQPIPPVGETFTLTNGQDTFSSDDGNDIFNAPLSGPFGNQETLTNLDKLVETGNPAFASTLNASFNGTHTALGVTIDGIGTWVLNQTSTEVVEIHGGPPNIIRGLTNLTYNDNGEGGSLELGEALFPILAGTVAAGFSGVWDGFVLNVLNAEGSTGHHDGHHHVDIAMAAGGFTGTDQINLTVSTVGFAHDSDLDDTYQIAAGSATAGFATWNVFSANSGGPSGPAVLNNIALGADGNSSATTVILTDDGVNTSTILYAAHTSGSKVDDWQNVTTIDASGTSGNVTITGGETDFGPNGGGFLAENFTALTTVIGGLGTDLFDLSSLTAAALAGLSVTGNSTGGNTTTVELSNTAATSVSGPVSWSGVNDLWIVDDGSLGGTLDMNHFPGTSLVNLVNEDSGQSPDPNQTAEFTVLNAPNVFTFNFNDTDQNGFDFEIVALFGGANPTLNVNYSEVEKSTGLFSSQNYDFVNITTDSTLDLVGPPDTAPFYSTGFFASAVPGGPNTELVTFAHTGDLQVGFEEPTVFGPHGVGIEGLGLYSGTFGDITTGEIDSGGTGVFELGVTNAFKIVDTSDKLLMDAPGNDIIPTFNSGGYSGIDVSATGSGSELQGTMGPLTTVAVTGGTVDTVTGLFGSDTLTDTAGGSNFYGAGGPDTINLGGGTNTIHFGEFDVNSDSSGAVVNQLITDEADFAYQGFWGVASGTGPTSISGSTSDSMTTITGFTYFDTLQFNTDAWAGGNLGPGALVTSGDGTNTTGTLVGTGAYAPELVATNFDNGGEVDAGINVVLYGIGGALVDAAALAAAITSGDTVGSFRMEGVIDANEHMLFAYVSTGGDIKIADVDFLTGVGDDASTSGSSVVASDVADLGNAVSLIGLGTNLGVITFVAHA